MDGVGRVNVIISTTNRSIIDQLKICAKCSQFSSFLSLLAQANSVTVQILYHFEYERDQPCKCLRKSITLSEARW